VAFVVLGIAIAILLKEKSFFGLMDITGYFGTWFSYARLLALSLATAGVALAINIIASKAQAFGKVGMVLWLVILVVGHLFNFALNILGCTIHAARLHYVEFFSFFYESGGYEFNPFKILNKK
jgi:V/A-type H+-transporting ATPase subunit I